MEYRLYTTVDITHTGQYRAEVGREKERWQEQNFQTLLQIIGIRANITFTDKPAPIQISGKVVGFNTGDIINVWQFEFNTERDNLFEVNGDPIGFLIEDFDGVPYIAGLDESMEQNYNVFVTEGKSRNIVFHLKQ